MKVQATALLALALAASTDAFAPVASRSSTALKAGVGGLDLPSIEAEVRRSRLECKCRSFWSFPYFIIVPLSLLYYPFIVRLQARPSRY